MEEHFYNADPQLRMFVKENAEARPQTALPRP